MRKSLVLLALLSGCGQSTGVLQDLGDHDDLARSSDGDMGVTTDAATYLKCSWALTDPALSGTIPATWPIITDGRMQCVIWPDSLEVIVSRDDGLSADFIVATGANPNVHVYRLMYPGRSQAIPVASCDAWTGTLTMTTPPPMTAVQFDLNCTATNGGYFSVDLGSPNMTHIAGSFTVSY